jgi:hypothetical protein
MSEIIIEDYFALKDKVQELEKENSLLYTRLEKLERDFVSLDKQSNYSQPSRIYKIYSTYQQSRTIIVAICFLFGNKILTNPWIVKAIFTFLFHKLK